MPPPPPGKQVGGEEKLSECVREAMGAPRGRWELGESWGTGSGSKGHEMSYRRFNGTNTHKNLKRARNHGKSMEFYAYSLKIYRFLFKIIEHIENLFNLMHKSYKINQTFMAFLLTLIHTYCKIIENPLNLIQNH